MKNINVKYLASAVATSGVMLASMTGACFAETVPVYLTAAATPIDITVGTGAGASDTHTHGANAIYMTAAADSNTATVTNLVVENNATSAPIYVTDIQLSNVTAGYTNAAYSDDFTMKDVDSKNFALAITSKDETTITAADLKTGYSSVDAIAASDSLSYGLSGKVSATSTAVYEEKVADCVITVSQTK